MFEQLFHRTAPSEWFKNLTYGEALEPTQFD